jgi:hypothetical protein
VSDCKNQRRDHQILVFIEKRSVRIEEFAHDGRRDLKRMTGQVRITSVKAAPLGLSQKQ